MKILHLIVGLEMGGAESMLYKMISGAMVSAPDEEHVVISFRKGGVFRDRLIDLGVAVHSLDINSGAVSLPAFVRLRRMVKEISPNVIECWMYHAMLAGVLVRWSLLKRIAIVWNVRNALHDLRSEKVLTRVVIRSTAWVSSYADKILFNSYVSCQQHIAIGYKSARTEVIPNGFDLDKFSPDSASRKRLSERFAIPAGVPVVGVVGRYHGVKGFEYFIEAAKLIADQADAWFLMIGEGLDLGNMVLVNRITSLSLNDRVVLAGLQLDVSSVLPGLTVYVNSSTSEAFANVIGEALACAVPSVVTDVGDSKRIVQGCAKVVPPKNPKVLADAVLEVLSKSEAEKSEMGRCGRNLIMRHYSIAVVVARYSKMFREVCPGLGGGSQLGSGRTAR